MGKKIRLYGKYYIKEEVNAIKDLYDKFGEKKVKEMIRQAFIKQLNEFGLTKEAEMLKGIQDAE